MTAEKCPECGAWWTGPSHRCPPVITTNTTALAFTPKPEDTLFLPAGPSSGKVECIVCGRIGWPSPPGYRYRWQEQCLAGHPYRCHFCQRAFVSAVGRANHQRLKHPRGKA